ncbi:MAG TPA: fatty acid-binding protein DegV [Lachnospiraceae bacterium]|nr:fatty acid-binding protein DegV [Lachnospiraceae bacterium]
MKWRIIADSSCDIFKMDECADPALNREAADSIYFSTVPFVITVDGKDYVDDEKIDVHELVAHMAKSSHSHTSCPSPESWIREFGEEGDVFAVTISSNLSGSYNSACTAREIVLEKNPDRRIQVLDSRGTGPSLYQIIHKLRDLILSGKSCEEVTKEIHLFMEDHKLIFALSSYHNLVNNGRMPKIAGIVLGHLGLWGIGIASEEGTIKMKKIAKGGKKTLKVIMSDFSERGANKGGIVISHCENDEFAQSLKKAVQSTYGDMNVKIMHTRGLCSYYAEKGGVIVGF